MADPPDGAKPTLFTRGTGALLRAASTVALRAPRRTLAVGLALAAGCLFYASTSLRIEADRNALIPEGRGWNERFERYRENFEGTRDLIVVVRGGTRSAREGYADALSATLEGDRWIERSFHRVDPDAFEGRTLLFLDEPAHADLRDALEEQGDDLARLAERPSLEGVLRLVDRRISSELVGHVVSGLFADPDEDADDATADDDAKPVDLGFLITLLEDLEEVLEPGGGAVELDSPWAELFGGPDADESGYLSARDGELLFVIVTPRTDAGLNVDAKAIRSVRAAQAELAPRFPELHAGLTGERAIAAAEMRATVEDTKRAGIIALLGVSAVFAIGFGRLRNPLLAVTALVIGIAWSAGATTLLVGHLTVLSVSFTSILIGLGIDFGIHIVSRYEEEHGEGVSRDDALVIALEQSGPGNVSGALTTSLAFFALGFTEFIGIAELGIIAGAGVLLCLLANLFMLPALIRIVPEAHSRWEIHPLHGVLTRATAWIYARPRALLAVGAAGVAAGLALAPTVGFNGNLLDLQAKGTEEVDLELELVQGEGFASAFAVSVVPDLPAARVLAAELEALPEVSRVESLANLVPPEQEARRERARELAPLLEPIVFSEDAPPPVDPHRLGRRVDQLRFKLRPGQEERWDPASRPEAGQIARARATLDRISERLHAVDEGTPLDADTSEALERYQVDLLDDLEERIERVAASTDPGAITPEDVPEDVRRRLVGHDGHLLLRIFPEENVWEDATRARFVAALRAVDPEVTGVPIQMLEGSRLMRLGYLEGGAYALAMVLFLVWFDLRRPRYVVAAFLPLLVGGAWTAGVMAIAELDFNLANMVILPVMIGIGIDIGIHSTHRWIQDGQAGRSLVSGSTGRAVVLSGLTTAIGFGTLAVARHQGLSSLGVLVGTGVLANVIGALLVLAPALDRPPFSRPAPPSPASRASDASAPRRSPP